MPFCHQCGYNLELGIEKFCPSCGYKIHHNGSAFKSNDNVNPIDIIDTKGDVFGYGFSGSGILAGKEIDYKVQGNVINLNISGGSISQEVLDNLQKIVSISTQVEPSSDKTTKSAVDFNTQVEESSKTYEQIKNVLFEVSQIEKKSGKNIEEIKVGELQISKSELSLKEIILRGNEHFYKNEYNEVIRVYDKALKLERNNFDLLFNKAYALDELGQYQ